MRSRAKLTLLCTCAAIALTGATVGRDYARAATFVVQAASIEGWPGTVAAWQSQPITTEPTTLATRHGAMTARVYRPGGGVRRVILMVPGVHASGIDEPRLVGFAGHVAQRGYVVVTAELPDLKAYSITPRTSDMIEDAARALAMRADLGADGRVGLIGISFAGGLSIVAAGRPTLREAVVFVLSFGGHSDFPRTLRYLCTGRLQDGTVRPPHDYGVVIILLGAADRLVPPDQVETLRRGILTFLEASHVDMVDKPRAQQLFRRARELAASMPQPSRTLMGYVNDRNVAALGARLLPHVEAFGDDPSLSPARSPAPAAPVFLLHGADDNVIPAEESVLLGEYLRSKTEVHVLLTPLITHAEVDRPRGLGDVWRLISFWADVLDQ